MSARTFRVFRRSSASARKFWLWARWRRRSTTRTHALSSLRTWPRNVTGTPLPPLPERWPADADPALANAFLGKLANMHGEVMGSGPHWYLEIIMTSGNYQEHGAGSMLASWGVKRADEKAGRVECYLDATPGGKKLPYERFDFRKFREEATFCFSNKLPN